jgi:hypothetical protein
MLSFIRKFSLTISEKNQSENIKAGSQKTRKSAGDVLTDSGSNDKAK